jgi:hypothetical protein
VSACAKKGDSIMNTEIEFELLQIQASEVFNQLLTVRETYETLPEMSFNLTSGKSVKARSLAEAEYKLAAMIAQKKVGKNVKLIN